MLTKPGYWLALGYWRLSELLDKIPGFNEGSEEAYIRHIHRHPVEED